MTTASLRPLLQQDGQAAEALLGPVAVAHPLAIPEEGQAAAAEGGMQSDHQAVGIHPVLLEQGPGLG